MRIAIIGAVVLVLVGTCAPVAAGEYNVKLSCATAEGLGLIAVRDLSEISWCTVRGRLPLGLAALSSTEANEAWGLPDAPEKPVEAVLSDPLFPQQWGLRAIFAPEAWQIEQGDAGTVVAVLDTGIDRNHPDLPPLFDCIDLVGSGCQDEHGHGTHVAGIVSMPANDVGGVGVAPGISLMSVKVLDADGVGDFSRIAAGIVGAARAGADIINMSFGGDRGSNLVDDALDYAESRGTLLVAACGNAGGSHLGDICLNPARRPNVLGVGAMNDRRVPAAWSNRRPDVLAPGVGIVSTLPGGRYAAWSGTSMAAPHVAGAAALYISVRGSFRPSTLRDRIEGTTTLIENCDAVLCGAGLVNALGLLTGTPRPTPTPPTATAYPPPEVTATPTLFFLTPTATTTAPVPRPTATPTDEGCTIMVNKVVRTDSIDRWWAYVGTAWLNALGRDGELLESFVISLPEGWWSLVLGAPSGKRCGLWRATFEELGYVVRCTGPCPSPAELEAIGAINVARNAQGLEPLEFDPALWRTARNKARRIADSDACTHNSEMIGCGFPFPTAAAMVDAWLDSAEHRRLILCEDCGYIGISHMTDDFWYHVWVAHIR